MTLTELKQLFELFRNNRQHVANALQSIEEDLVTFEQLIEREYFAEEDKFYSSEEYVRLYDGEVCHRDSACWCEGMEEYFDEGEEFVKVYEGRSECYYSLRYVQNRGEYSFYDGAYYDDYAMDRHGLVYIEDLSEIGSQDDCYYHEDRGWYSYPDNSECYTRGYHNGSYQSVSFDNKSKYKIGYEIEKEDTDILESIEIDEFEDKTDYKWRKEKDGSLDESMGYELISPSFEFNIDKIFEHIESNNILLDHINAKYSTSCGGHIHLSENGVRGEELFDKVKGYTPLFYALYHGRVNKNYCKGKNNSDLKNENEKYQAIKIHHDRIEFRIISAVPNVTTLKWRSKLLMMILQHPTDDVMKAYYNVDTKFTKLLSQVYSDDKLSALKDRFITYTEQFENLTINK